MFLLIRLVNIKLSIENDIITAQILPSSEKCLSRLSKPHSIFEVYKNQNVFPCCLRSIRLPLVGQVLYYLEKKIDTLISDLCSKLIMHI